MLAFDEPVYQAGMYRDVLVRRWRNLLGRTMWDFPGGRTGGNRYLVLGFGTGQADGLTLPLHRDELIAYGPLLSDDGAAWLGHGGVGPGAGPGHGSRRSHRGAVRRHRGAQLAVRRAAVVIRGRRKSSMRRGPLGSLSILVCAWIHRA